MTTYYRSQGSGGARGGGSAGGSRGGGSAGARGGGSGSAGGARPGMPRRFGRGRKVCTFCVDKVESIDYKSVNRIRRYMSDRARIESGKRTGTCARHQRMLRLAIKRARFMAMLPLAPNHLRVTGPVSQGGRGPAATPAEDAAPIAAEDGDLLESEEDGEDVSQGEERDGGGEKS